MTTLGLERRQAPAKSLEEYLAERYGGEQETPGSPRTAEPHPSPSLRDETATAAPRGAEAAQ